MGKKGIGDDPVATCRLRIGKRDEYDVEFVKECTMLHLFQPLGMCSSMNDFSTSLIASKAHTLRSYSIVPIHHGSLPMQFPF